MIFDWYSICCVEEKKCMHCGAPYKGNTDFCCRGCDYVYHLIRKEGLDRYYDLKDRTLPPVGSSAFRQRDDRQIQENWKQAEEHSPGVVSMEFELKGISCVGCVWLIERLFTRYEGNVRIDIDPQRGKIVIDANCGFDIAGFAAEIQRYGYTLREWSGGDRRSGGSGAGSRLGVCGFLAMNAMVFNLPFYLGMESENRLAPLLQLVVMVLSTFSVLVGGTYFFRRAWAALRMGVLHIDLPISLGIIVAYVGSFIGWIMHDSDFFYFDFITIFILLMLIGRWLQERVTENNIQQGYAVDPSEQKITLLGGEDVKSIPVKEVETGMRYTLDAGGWIPVQSRLVNGRILLSLESINGESDPREFVEGEMIPSGAVLLSRGEMSLEATESWKHSLLKRLFEINSAGAREEGMMERILKVYILSVVGMAVFGLLLWGIGAHEWKTGLQVTVSILVVSCPCAIGLAYPRVNDLCAQWLRNRGVYIRLHSMWARLGGVRQVFFDKTGTLTLETLELLNSDDLQELDVEQRLALYALVEGNLHPVARSLKEHLLTLESSLSGRAQDLPLPREQVGFGVTCDWQGKQYSLAKSQDSDQMGETAFQCDGKTITSFIFSDSIRNDVREAIGWLEEHDLKVSVISGDNPEKVREIMDALGLPQERGVGGMSPAEKAEWIDQYAKAQGMMIGDGANDALAFEKARCRATPVIGRGVLENHSDFFFLGKGIGGVVDVFRLAFLRQRAVREILTITIVYNLIAVSVSLAAWMNPLLAAVLMPISSIVTVSWATFRLAKSRLDRSLLVHE